MTKAPRANGIGQLNERALHAALCGWCAGPGDAREVDVDGYRIDVVSGELLVEVQTGNFSALRTKLTRLLEAHPVRVVYPIAEAKWIVRLPSDDDAGVPKRRKSPKRGRPIGLFDELVRIPTLALHPGFSLLVVMMHEEEYWKADGKGSWRRGGVSIVDRRLLDVVATRMFSDVADYAALLPTDLESFTCRDLAEALTLRLPLARRMAYCLHKMGVLEQEGVRARQRVWRRCPPYVVPLGHPVLPRGTDGAPASP